jgi:hypothetical protein
MNFLRFHDEHVWHEYDMENTTIRSYLMEKKQ